MKKIQFLLFAIVLFLLGSSKVNGQIGVSINLNLQPQWGPTDYDYVEYYYMPEYDLYYYAPQKQFIYQKGNRWVTVNSLPYQYRHANLYNTYKVVINEPRPYLKHKYYADHYRGYKGKHSQQTIIRDSRDSRYERRNEHPDHRENNRFVRSEHKNMHFQGNRNDNKGKGQKKEGKGNKKH
jgi:hypothetical protein